MQEVLLYHVSHLHVLEPLRSLQTMLPRLHATAYPSQLVPSTFNYLISALPAPDALLRLIPVISKQNRKGVLQSQQAGAVRLLDLRLMYVNAKRT